MNMLTEAKRLYDLGWPVHWCHKKQKRPIDVGWQNRPSKTWEELEHQYEEGMNLGVRTGFPVPTGYIKGSETGYLVALDCDLKSKEDKHRDEMLQAVHDLLGPLLSKTWVVMSGRGNGSRHLYFLANSQCPSKLLAKSSEKVGNKNAWEVSFMSLGRQVILPPSIHPETKKPYSWDDEINSGRTLGLIRVEGLFERIKAQVKSENRSNFEFNSSLLNPNTFEKVDLISSPLSEPTYQMILEGCDDESHGVFLACMSLIKAGFTDAQILSVMTDQDYALGQTAYRHAQTENRSRAAQWIERYPLKKAKEYVGAENEFKGAIVEEKLGEAETVAQEKQLTSSSDDWKDQLERTEKGNRLKNTFNNVRLILQNEPERNRTFSHNEFAFRNQYSIDTPWGGKKGAEIQDIDAIRIKTWLAQKWKFEPDTKKIEEAISWNASQNPFHPVRQYLEKLEWDQVPRLDTWIKTYLQGSGPEPYLSAISRKCLCALVARAYHPGVKHDYLVVLEGKQGVGKSTSLRILGGDWFSDSPITIGNKDAINEMQSVWVYEFGELSGLKKADMDQFKEFVSRTVDRARLAFNRHAGDFPRQCVFFGTTNSREYLRDQTGNRRFWPIGVGDCDFEGLKRDRDQLFAEARFAYEIGEALYLDEPEAAAQAIEMQEWRMEHDEWGERLKEFFSNPPEVFDTGEFTLSELFEKERLGPLATFPLNYMAERRTCGLLRKLGFEKRRIRRDGKQTNRWMKDHPRSPLKDEKGEH